MHALAGIYLRLGEQMNPEVNRRVRALATSLAQQRLPGITEIVPCYASIYVEYRTDSLSAAKVRAWAESVPPADIADGGRTVRLPVRYDGRDLEAVAAATSLSVAEVVRRHSETDYLVHAVGFTPGFAFMGAVHPSIRLPRLTTPRPAVPAGTVAMADGQTGIYPLASPGGWHQLGTVGERIYDPHRERPTLLEAGDVVRFQPLSTTDPATVDGDLTPEPLKLLPEDPLRPRLRVLEPGLLDILVDGGRFGVAALGLARSGPLDSLSAATANRLVGNPADAPLLELNAKGPVLEALDNCVVAFAGFGVAPLLGGRPVAAFTTLALTTGATLSFPPLARGARGYLALAGGIESAAFRGSAAVDVRGLIGRPLRAGDVLGVAEPGNARPGHSFEPYVRWPAAPTARPGARLRSAGVRFAGARFAEARFAAARSAGVVRLLPGPQAEREALAALTDARFRVLRADRMGLQLDGGVARTGRPAPPVPGRGILSEPTALGAVQVTPGGQPLILLHDRGTIGGYSKPAVIHPHDLPVVGQLRAGDTVRFKLLPQRRRSGSRAG